MEILTSCYARGRLFICFEANFQLNGRRKKKLGKKTQSSTKLNKHNSPRKKISHEPTPDVIKLYLFIQKKKKASKKEKYGWVNLMHKHKVKRTAG